VLDGVELTAHARELGRAGPIERVETIDEPMVAATAKVRAELGLGGLTPDQARLCRDKAAMKDALRRAGHPLRRVGGGRGARERARFAEREGYPLVLKPREGYGTLNTFKVDDAQALDACAGQAAPRARTCDRGRGVRRRARGLLRHGHGRRARGARLRRATTTRAASSAADRAIRRASPARTASTSRATASCATSASA
jgi:hypothetical protein